MSRDSDPWPLADRVRQVESQRGLSVRRAAAIAGMPKSTYFDATRGAHAPSQATQDRLFAFAGVDLAAIIREL